MTPLTKLQRLGQEFDASPRVLTDDDKRVIRERHFGWEGASPGLLARVFGVSVQAINAVIAAGLCRACKRRLDVCTCPDAVAAGLIPLEERR